MLFNHRHRHYDANVVVVSCSKRKKKIPDVLHETNGYVYQQ